MLRSGWKFLGRNEMFVSGGLAIILIGLFARTMNEDLRHDEHMFVTSGVLFKHLSLYTQYTYSHLPNLPILFGSAFAVLGTDHFLLVSRLIVFLAWIAVLLSMYLLAQRLTGERWIGVLAALFLATNSVLIGHGGVVGTPNLIRLVFPILAFYFFLAGIDAREPRPLHILLCGICLSLAVGFKVNYIVIIPPFVILACLVPWHASAATRFKRVLLPLFLGGIVGAVSIFAYLAIDPDAFLFSTLEMHLFHQDAFWGVDELGENATGLTLSERIFYAYRLWFFGSSVLIFVVAAYLIAVLASKHGSGFLRALAVSWPLTLSAMLLAVTVGMALSIRPSFPQYYVPPIPFAMIFAICLYRILDQKSRVATKPFLATAAVVTVVMGGPFLLQDVPQLLRPGGWAVSKVHEVGEDIASALAAKSIASKKVATLTSLYPLEGGLEIYPELAAGPFFFRIGDDVTAQERSRFHITSAASLASLLDAEPPAAILVGFEGHLDQPLIDYAKTHGYLPLKQSFGRDRYGIGVLYVRTSSQRASSEEHVR